MIVGIGDRKNYEYKIYNRAFKFFIHRYRVKDNGRLIWLDPIVIDDINIALNTAVVEYLNEIYSVIYAMIIDNNVLFAEPEILLIFGDITPKQFKRLSRASLKHMLNEINARQS